MIPVSVEKISYHPSSRSYAVLLKDEKSNLVLPILVGSFEAQSIALAIEVVATPRPLTHDLICDIINKIDAPNANLESAITQTIDLLGCNEDDILAISAKEATGIDSVLSAIIDKIPPPAIPGVKGTRALIFDSKYDQFRGVVPYVRIFDGFLEKGMTTQYFAKPGGHEITEVGILKMNKRIDHVILKIKCANFAWFLREGIYYFSEG